MPNPPLPRELKLLKGTFQKSREPENVAEPECLDEVPEPPASLEGVAVLKWREQAGNLAKCRVLRKTDLDALESYCLAYELMVTTACEVRVDGVTITDDKGAVKRNPATSVLAAAQAELRQWSTLLGLNPSARGRIAVPPTGNKPGGLASLR